MIQAIWSPYIVPIVVFIWMTIVAVAKVIGKAQANRVMAEQRIAMLQRGMTPEQIAVVLQPVKDEEEVEEAAKIKDPLRSLANARRAAVLLIAVGIGIALFGYLLALIVGDHEVLVVSATGLLPLVIGIGFFVDYNLQKRELSRFGLEVGAEPPPVNRPS